MEPINIFLQKKAFEIFFRKIIGCTFPWSPACTALLRDRYIDVVIHVIVLVGLVKIEFSSSSFQNWENVFDV